MIKELSPKLTKSPRLLAEFIHDVYEKKSKKTGWKTQEKTRVEFKKLPEENKKVMLHVSKKIIQLFEEDSMENWLKLCNMAIFDHDSGKDISKYAISKGNLQIDDILQWHFLKAFIESVIYKKVIIKDRDLKLFKEAKNEVNKI